jgi:hypothetical protein
MISVATILPQLGRKFIIGKAVSRNDLEQVA